MIRFSVDSVDSFEVEYLLEEIKKEYPDTKIRELESMSDDTLEFIIYNKDFNISKLMEMAKENNVEIFDVEVKE